MVEWPKSELRLIDLPEDARHMRKGARIGAVIPALNEEDSIGKVLSAIPDWVDDVVVADNGSSDRTASTAEAHGARVVHEYRRGYGAACLTGIAHLKDPDIILFLDGDYSDYPEEAASLVDPIAEDRADMVIGSRVLGNREPGALTPQAQFGNWLACLLMRLLWQVRYTDLGPFRAIATDAFTRLHMRDLDYGWTVEMQIKAAKLGLRSIEVPVSYRKRIGKSKVSGTVRGVIGAGTKILWTIAKEATGTLPELAEQSLRERIIVFTRYPEAGSVKTRLAPVLGAHGAADLHRQMTEHIVARVRRICESRGVLFEVRYDGQSRIAMNRWLGHAITYRKQESADLGERMNAAFRQAFYGGSERVLLIGSDCPGITGDLLERGLDALGDRDAVFGPAADGGYYLVGLKRMCPELFSDMTWGTSDVLERTLERASAMNLSLCLLDRLHDVDRPEDLSVWEAEKTAQEGDQSARASGKDPAGMSSQSGTVGLELPGVRQRRLGNQRGLGCSRSESAAARIERISVIIPTLNEAGTLAAAVASVGSPDDVEIIVVDGGSDDDTTRVAESLGVEVLTCPRGRAMQMNRGADEATADILLFLHADTRLPIGWADHVRETLSRPGVSCGAFRFRTDGSAWSLRIIESLANMRAVYFQMPYGDQALFMRADLFTHIRGFPNIPIMEDFEFVRNARKHGRVSIAGSAVRTSSRRWEQFGIWRTTLVNQAIIVGYVLGVPLSALSRLRGSSAERAPMHSPK